MGVTIEEARVRPSGLLASIGLVSILAGAALWRLGGTLDQTIFDALKLDPGDLVAPLVRILSGCGGLAALGPLAFAVVLWLCWRRRIGEALWLFATIASGRLIIEGLKILFARSRPPVGDRLAEVVSYSFPSSHSAGSMLTALTLAMVLPVRGRTMLPLAIALACVIGWSRIALGVHWPSDVLAGLGFGMLWAGIARRWLPGAGLGSARAAD